MRISFEKIRKKSGSLVSMTSLRETEFIDLAACFEIEFEKYLRVYTLEGKKRDRPVVNPRKNSTFPTAEDKLLFILMYLKTYPLQAVVAAQYGMSQPQVNRWISLLRTILLETLNRKGCLPTRDLERLQTMLAGETATYHDATEREILRPGDYEVQGEYYSGKKTALRKESRDR
jgi:hypothetical protein